MNPSICSALNHPHQLVTRTVESEYGKREPDNKIGDIDNELFVKRIRTECKDVESPSDDDSDLNGEYPQLVSIDGYGANANARASDLDQTKIEQIYCENEIKREGDSTSSSENSSDSSDSDESDDDFTEVPSKPEESPVEQVEQAEPDGQKVLFKYIHGILKHLQTIYMNNAGAAKPYDDVFRDLGLQHLSSFLFAAIRSNSANSESKIEVTLDGKLRYKPKYKILSAEDLIELLSPPSGELPGILLKDIKSSLPNHHGILQALQGRFLSVKSGPYKDDVYFSNRPNIVGQPSEGCKIDEKFKAYLKESNDTERSDIAKKIGKHSPVAIKVNTKTGNKKAFKNYRCNTHKTDLVIYGSNEMNALNPDKVAGSTAPPPKLKDIQIPDAAKMLIWEFTTQVFKIEDAIVLYSIAHNPGMTQTNLSDLLKLSIVCIRESLKKMETYHLIYKTEEKSRGTCYFVDLKAIVAWVHKRLDTAKKKIEEFEKVSAFAYVCPRCQKKFDDLDVKQLIKGNDWSNLVCWICQIQVCEIPRREATRDLCAMFNSQTDYFLEFLKQLPEYQAVSSATSSSEASRKN